MMELRFVIHRDTYARLFPPLPSSWRATFCFVDHVALMGLEMTGFAKTNADALWIDPVEYQPQLVEGSPDHCAGRAAEPVRLRHNHPALRAAIPGFTSIARKSISGLEEPLFRRVRAVSPQG